MTTTLAFTFPWGRYHATPWGRHPNEGDVEWPPSPWRIIRSLLYGWKVHAPDLDASVVNGLVRALANDLPEYRLPAHRAGHTRHYLPSAKHTVVNYARDKVFDAFHSFDPNVPMTVTWPVTLAAAEREALQRMTAGIGYLGRRESVCDAHVVDGPGEGVRWRATDDVGADDERIRLLAPEVSVQLDDLLVAPRDMRNDYRLRPVGARQVTYARAEAAPVVLRERAGSGRRTPTGVNAVRWHLRSPAAVRNRATLALTHVLRQASLKSFDGDTAQLSGKTPTGVKRTDHHRHAHYLAFSFDVDRRDGAALDTAVVWIPDAFGEAEVTALARLTRLWTGDHQKDLPNSISLVLEGLGDVRTVAPELCGPARQWSTVTPVVLTRRLAGKNATFSEHLTAAVRAEAVERHLVGADDAEHVEVDVDPSAEWRRFRRHRPGQRLVDQHRRGAPGAAFVTVRFPAPVEGPVTFGRLSHFGVGLLRPDDG